MTALDCKNLDRQFQSINVQNSENTASPTTILFTNFMNETQRRRIPAVIKITMNADKMHDKLYSIENVYNEVITPYLGLAYETKVYKNIVPKMLKFSPNFVPYITSGTCSVGDIINLDPSQTVMTNLYELYGYRNITMNTKMDLLVTGRPPGNVYTLDHIFDELSAPDKLNILFQIIFSLVVMNRFRLVHNDLHADNILVSKLSRPITLYYKYKQKIFKITTQYVPYIFDWDRAFSDLLGPNKLLDKTYCDMVNTCNRFSSKFDLDTLLCLLDYPEPFTQIFRKDRLKSNILNKRRIELPRNFNKTTFKTRFRPFYIYDDRKRDGIMYGTKVYRLSSLELQSQFGRQWVYENFDRRIVESEVKGAPDTSFPHITSLTFYIQKNYLYTLNVFTCRFNSLSPHTPTPDQILEDRFFDIFITRRELPRNARVYECPNHRIPRRSLYIDRTRSTKHLIPHHNLVSFRKAFRMQTNIVARNVSKHIKSTYRSSIVNWIITVCTKYFQGSIDIILDAIRFFDLFITTHTIKGEDHHLSAGVAIFAAARKEGVKMDPAELAPYFMGKFSFREIDVFYDSMKKMVNSRIGKHHVPNAYRFFRIFSQKIDYKLNELDMREYIIEMAKLNTIYSQIKPSMIAAIAMYSRGALYRENTWNNVLIKMTGYTIPTIQKHTVFLTLPN